MGICIRSVFLFCGFDRNMASIADKMFKYLIFKKFYRFYTWSWNHAKNFWNPEAWKSEAVSNEQQSESLQVDPVFTVEHFQSDEEITGADSFILVAESMDSTVSKRNHRRIICPPLRERLLGPWVLFPHSFPKYWISTGL